MHEMVKGGNTSLAELFEDADSVVVGLGWSSATGEGDADVSVLLLNADGKVRSDADFFFYNNPTAQDGSVHLLGKVPTSSGSEDRISLDLSAVPAEVERIVVAASRYGGCFGELSDLRVTLADRTGESLLGFSISDAAAETAIIFGELYRRGTGWKFRAVGQGYESGLAGLATDFGIDVDDAGEDEELQGQPQEQAREQPVPHAPATVPPARSAAVEAPVTATPEPAVQCPPQAGPPATLAPGASPPSAPRRPRTAKRKVTVPKVAKKSLAENDSWQQARLFPVSSLKSDREREARATSILLSVMAQVPEFGRRITAAYGAPAGRIETYTEVSLPHGDSPRRPDGVIRVERAGKLWTALVETKTNGNALKAEQVQNYMDIAARRGYESVIALSNDVALDDTPLVDVRIDRRRKHKVAVHFLSWAEVTHQAQMLIRHEGVSSVVHAWLLQELLHYLQHDNSGCHGFQNMGPAWVPVRNGIDTETLCQGDRRAVEVVESWERLIRQVSLRLGGELGEKVLPAQRARRGSDPRLRRTAMADQLCESGRLQAELRMEGVPGVFAIAADLRTGKLRTSIDLPAPDQGSPLTVVKRLVRRLDEAPADLHVETLPEHKGPGPRGTLERLRPEPGDLVPRDGARIAGFRLSLFKGMGSTRGNAETGFIRSVDDAVDRFYNSVLARLERRPTLRSQSAA